MIDDLLDGGGVVDQDARISVRYPRLDEHHGLTMLGKNRSDAVDRVPDIGDRHDDAVDVALSQGRDGRAWIIEAVAFG